MLWISILGTFSLKGTLFKRLIKVILGFFSLPQSLWILGSRVKKAALLLDDFPQIPPLEETTGI